MNLKKELLQFIEEQKFPLNRPFLLDLSPEKKYVAVPLKQWNKMVEDLEDYEDLQVLNKLDPNEETIPFEDVKKRLGI